VVDVLVILMIQNWINKRKRERRVRRFELNCILKFCEHHATIISNGGVLSFERALHYFARILNFLHHTCKLDLNFYYFESFSSAS